MTNVKATSANKATVPKAILKSITTTKKRSKEEEENVFMEVDGDGNFVPAKKTSKRKAEVAASPKDEEKENCSYKTQCFLCTQVTRRLCFHPGQIHQCR